MKANSSIACQVEECKNHCNDTQHCTLNSIQIKKHTQEAVTTEQTDCASFCKK